MAALPKFLRSGGVIAWALIIGVVVLAAASTALLANTLQLRYERDVSRMVFNDNLDVLENVQRELGIRGDSLNQVLASASDSVPVGERPYLVVSIAENRVWYKRGQEILFEAPVATGSGKVLVKDGGTERWKFETPRGRMVVLEKEENPAWIPPDWHFIEAARNRGLGVTRLQRGQTVPLNDGAVLTTSGSDVVRQYPDGRIVPYTVADGREIVAGGTIVIPPFGTTQRKYPDVLGTRRLKLGDGYALHGTNRPETVGTSVSHGCVRLRNSDIEKLYDMVEVGTPVYIY